MKVAERPDLFSSTFPQWSLFSSLLTWITFSSFDRSSRLQIWSKVKQIINYNAAWKIIFRQIPYKVYWESVLKLKIGAQHHSLQLKYSSNIYSRVYKLSRLPPRSQKHFCQQKIDSNEICLFGKYVCEKHCTIFEHKLVTSFIFLA